MQLPILKIKICNFQSPILKNKTENITYFHYVTSNLQFLKIKFEIKYGNSNLQSPILKNKTENKIWKLQSAISNS